MLSASPAAMRTTALTQQRSAIVFLKLREFINKRISFHYGFRYDRREKGYGRRSFQFIALSDTLKTSTITSSC
jgi:hypothetical protein